MQQKYENNLPKQVDDMLKLFQTEIVKIRSFAATLIDEGNFAELSSREAFDEFRF